jgi:PAS domain S-box-containing protein
MDLVGLFRSSQLPRTALIFLPLAALSVGVLYVLYQAQVQAAREVLEGIERNRIEFAQQLIGADLRFIVSDALYLSEQPALQRWLASDTAETRQHVKAQYLALANYRPGYDQVRFLDASGREQLRVDATVGGARATPDAELQDKADRPYTRNALKLGPREVFISALDLNVEGGAIEQPIKPTIRVATAVFDDQGRKRGIVVVNYLYRGVLERLRQLRAEAGQIWLLNADGDVLLGPDPADEWAFMYPDRAGRGFGQRFPAVWRAAREGDTIGQFDADGDLYSYVRIVPATMAQTMVAQRGAAIAAGAPSWLVITRLPEHAAASRTEPVRNNLTVVGSALLVVFLAISWLIARYWADRRVAQQQIQQSEARFRGLLDAAPDAILIADAHGRIVLTNARTEAMFGYPRSELIGKPVELLVPNRFRDGHAALRDGYITSPSVRPMGARLELYGQRRDGSEVPVSISLSPVQTESQLLIFADIRDVTDQREIDRQLRELNVKLERDNAALDALNKELESFSYSVSHDLRAPLRAIDGFSQAVMEDYAGKLDANGRNYLQRVRAAAQRMGMLIDDLLKLARISRMDVEWSEVDLSGMGREVARDLKEAEPDRAATFDIADQLTVHGDPRLLRVALDNLLGNAWKFTKGRDPAVISLGRTDHNGETAYFVRDNGAGFDMTYADKLFGAFQRLHDAKEFPGTGIGLATVQRVLRKHGGRIWAEAAPDRGATFYFQL